MHDGVCFVTIAYFVMILLYLHVKVPPPPLSHTYVHVCVEELEHFKASNVFSAIRVTSFKTKVCKMK